MEVSATREDGGLMIRPAFERLDASVAHDFKEASAQLARGERRVAIDMSQIVFIDSAGLGSLVALMRSLEDGAKLRLHAPTRHVRTLLRLTRLDTVLELVDPAELAA